MFNRPLQLQPVNLVTRAEWGAKPPLWQDPITEAPVHHYVVEYAARRSCYNTNPPDGDLSAVMRQLQRNHMKQKNCPDIKYNFLVGYDGRVYEGRGWTIKPTLPEKYDKIKDLCVFIAWIGRFTDSKTALEIEPPDQVCDTRRNLMHMGMAHKYVSHIIRVFFIKQGNHKRRGDFGTDWE